MGNLFTDVLECTLTPEQDQNNQPTMNKVALNSFLAQVEKKAFVMARIATKHEDDALDLVQDAMMTLSSSYGDRTEAEWAPLFHRILQNKITDWHRKSNLWQRIWARFDHQHEDEPTPLEELDSAPEHLEPLNQVVQQLSTQQLIDRLEVLPSRQQQALLLRLWQGMSVAETAAAMDCSEGSVKTHLNRAVQKLREQLSEHWHDR